MDEYTGTVVYLIHQESKECALICAIYKYEKTGKYHLIPTDKFNSDEDLDIFLEMTAGGVPVNYEDIMAMIKL